jgi:hypothetical protein
VDEKVVQLVNEFKEYRQEKQIIKSIKFKAEVIKATGSSGKVFDKVCRHMALGKNQQ